MTQSASENEKHAFWKEQIQNCPPRIAFTKEMRSALPSLDGTLDHIEFLMIWLENHPLIPISQYTFGSDLLDRRRAVAYEVIVRVLAHLRSFVVNANIRNKPGAGTALRCMLDLYALIEYLQTGGRLQDEVLLDKFLSGQQFARGSDYFLNREWSKDTGQPLPVDVKKVLESWLGLPRTGLITQAAHDADEGFSAMYAHYSEYVHFAVAGPRQEIEELYESLDPSPFGSENYFNACQKDGVPYTGLKRDLETVSFTLQLIWPRLIDLDPFLASDTKPAVVKTLAEQGCK